MGKQDAVWKQDVRKVLEERNPGGFIYNWQCPICMDGPFHKVFVCFNPAKKKGEQGCYNLQCGSCFANGSFAHAMDGNANPSACSFCRKQGTYCTFLYVSRSHATAKCDRKRNPQKYKYRNAIGRCFCPHCTHKRKVTRHRFDQTVNTPFISTWWDPVVRDATKNRMSAFARAYPWKTITRHFNGVEIYK